MAHNSYIRAIGTWTTGSTVTAAEFEAIGLQLYQSINGDLGGTWAPSSQIEIGGSGLRVSATFELYYGGGVSKALGFDATTGIFDLRGNVNGSGDNVWSGVNQFTSNVEFDGPIACVGATVTFDAASSVVFSNQPQFHNGLNVSAGAATFGGLVHFSDVADFNAEVYFNDIAHFSGATTLAGTNTISGATSLTDKMTLSGSGQVVKRLTLAADADGQSFNVGASDIVKCGVQTATRAWSLVNTGAVSGSVIKFFGGPANHVVLTVTTLGSVTLGTAAGEYDWVEFTYTGSQYEISGWAKN